MSRLVNYWNGALQGVERYFGENKLIVLLIVLFLASIFGAQKMATKRAGRLLSYTLIMVGLLVCPFSAMCILVYQTGYYDYEWAWSLVPVTAVIAYGSTLFVEKCRERVKFFGSVFLVASVFFLCGNQGTIQTLSQAEVEAASDIHSILQCLEQEPGEKVIWAPKAIMQQARRKDGSILLVYGRDMWDAKAGAYDYEAYDATLTEAYLWLENIAELERHISVSLKKEEVFALTWEDENAEDGLAEYLQVLMENGANTYVLPKQTATYVEDFLRQEAEQRGVEVSMANTDKYTIYFLK